jgi:2-polyprenyl-3-methyl-5-hydroxy-6-metoxy-1,4-benzoquinol methylase
MKMSQASSTQDFYIAYGEWKNWSPEDFMRVSADDARYWGKEAKGLKISGGNVLEIGFGNGTFLGWAKAQGATLSGTEIYAPARALAEQAGITLLPEDFSAIASSYSNSFDVIAAFDVMEHLTHAQNMALLHNAAIMLKPGGHFIARFPNGQSPFGRFYQHGDQTHISTLSVDILNQMIAGLPYALVRAGNTAPQLGGDIARRVKRMMRYVAQLCVENLIGFIYAFKGALGANSIIVLQRVEGVNAPLQ